MEAVRLQIGEERLGELESKRIAERIQFAPNRERERAMERSVLHDIAPESGPVPESTLAAEFHGQSATVEILRAHEDRRNRCALEAPTDDRREIINDFHLDPDASPAVRDGANGRGRDEPLGAQESFRFAPVDFRASGPNLNAEIRLDDLRACGDEIG